MKSLEVKGITKKFGGLVALENLDLELCEGEILGLIGPNGAGKTTFFNIITGVYFADKGEIILKGEEIGDLKPHQRCRKGIGRTFQSPTIAENLTVLENIRVGQHYQYVPHFFSTLLNSRGWRKRKKLAEKRAVELLEIVGIESWVKKDAGSLPHGIKRRLQIAIALSTEPEVLLLDEVASGMQQSEKIETMNLIRTLPDMGVSCVVIEHDMNVIKGVCGRIAVLNFGVKIAEGVPEEVVNNQEVVKAYLGEEDA